MGKKILAVIVIALLLVASVVAVFVLTMGEAEPTPTVEKKANIVVTSLEVDKHHVLVGHETTVTISLLNNGTALGYYRLNLSMDGSNVRMADISLGVGNSTTLSYDISSPTAGNHTVSVDNTTTYLNCYDRFAVGYNDKCHVTGHDEATGSFEYNYTNQIISVNDTAYTISTTYDDDEHLDTVTTYNAWYVWTSDGLENYTYKGVESVLTNYGVKNLTRYSYTADSGGYHFVIDMFVDVPTFVVFRAITTTDGFIMTEEMVETSADWVKEI